MKKYSTSLITREMQIRTTVRYCFTSVRMAIIKKVKDNKYWQGCGEKQTLTQCWWNCTAMMENNMEVPQKIKNRATT
jgi:hypothetical protein